MSFSYFHRCSEDRDWTGPQTKISYMKEGNIVLSDVPGRGLIPAKSEKAKVAKLTCRAEDPKKLQTDLSSVRKKSEMLFLIPK